MGREGCRGRSKGSGRNRGKDNAGAGVRQGQWQGRPEREGGGRAGLDRARYGRLN